MSINLPAVSRHCWQPSKAPRSRHWAMQGVGGRWLWGFTHKYGRYLDDNARVVGIFQWVKMKFKCPWNSFWKQQSLQRRILRKSINERKILRGVPGQDYVRQIFPTSKFSLEALSAANDLNHLWRFVFMKIMLFFFAWNTAFVFKYIGTFTWYNGTNPVTWYKWKTALFWF